MIGLYYETEKYTDALALGGQLLKELKKLDDKNLLVEVRETTLWHAIPIGRWRSALCEDNVFCLWVQVQLVESKTYHALGNLQKARAALTSARTTANSIYIPPKVQVSLCVTNDV